MLYIKQSPTASSAGADDVELGVELGVELLDDDEADEAAVEVLDSLELEGEPELGTTVGPPSSPPQPANSTAAVTAMVRIDFLGIALLPLRRMFAPRVPTYSTGVRIPHRRNYLVSGSICPYG